MYNITNPEDLGRVIALWSPIHRQGAVSTTTALIASYLAEQMDTENNEKILIMNNEVYGSPTASFYMTTEDMIDGMQEVIQLSLSDNLKKPEEIYTNTFSVSNRIDILNCGKRNRDLGDLLEQEIGNILNMARIGYKYILVDTVCGPHDKSTREILKNSDLVVTCLPQDRYLFDSWVRKTPGIYLDEFKGGKKLVTLSALHCEYPDMKYDSMKKEAKGQTLHYISLNDVIHGAVGKRNVPDFIRANLKSKAPDIIINELDEIIQDITNKITTIIDKELQEKSYDIEKNKKETFDYLKGISIADINDELYDSEAVEDLEVTDEDLYGPSDTDTDEQVEEITEEQSEEQEQESEYTYGNEQFIGTEENKDTNAEDTSTEEDNINLSK